ncbi:MAG: N-acetylmuramic acid 6-phosphate etherase [Candidatus Tyloplasma litorale]|nr:MAG: N-acetylmuramic acid 6-phosphate etherase [Mycoplasmatales bacterium]
MNIKNISTEKRNLNTMKIDKASSLEIAKLINNEDKTIPLAIEKELKSIADAIDLGYLALKNNSRIFYIGAGTSGRLGVLDASEMPPTFNVDANMIIGIIAGGEEALRKPIEGAEDSIEKPIIDLQKFQFNKHDVLIGITASGRTPYVLSGLKYAKELGAKTISISTSKNSEVGQIVDVKIEVITGSEPITGSTRMKSGTAQKMILNMISTGVMIKLGKVYQNWMIDVRSSNEKLYERAINMVMEITNCSREKSIETLKKCEYSPKLAVIMILKNVSLEKSKKMLIKNNNKLSEVL